MYDNISQSINLNKNLFEVNNDTCVFRCINCFQIPLITLFKENNEPKIKYICECTLSEKDKYKIISIKEFLENFNQLSLNSMMCEDCEKENVKEMNFCLTCKKPFCDKCIQNHNKNNSGHEMINIDKLDNYCHIHKDEKIVAWCIECKVNICTFCYEYHENCEYRIIEDIKLKNDELEKYKINLSKITAYFYDRMNGTKNNMISKCNNNNDKDEINNLYQKYYEINNNLIKLSQFSILTYLLYANKYTYPIIKNIKNLCNFTLAIKFKENGTIEQFKNYLKKLFIIQSSQIEQPKKRIYNEEERKKIIDDIFNNIGILNNIDMNKDELYQGYSLYSHIENPTKTNISKLTCVKTIKVIGCKINSILLLKDKNFALTIGGEINIFEPNNFKVLIVIKRHEYFIVSLVQLKDNINKLASGDIKGNIKLWIYDEQKYQCIGNIISTTKIQINNLIHLSDGNLLSLTLDCLEIWKTNTPYNNILKISSDKNIDFLSSLETQNNILVVGMRRGFLKFYKPDDLSLIHTLEKIYCSCYNNIIQIDKNRIAIGGVERIRIVNIEIFKLEKIIVCKSLLTSLILLKDNTLLTGENDSSLRQYDIETCSYIGEIANSCIEVPICLSQINEQFIISANVDSANFWQY